MIDCDFDDPSTVVRCFICEMNAWETEAHRLLRAARGTVAPASYQGQALAALTDVFDRYCTPKPRPYGRNGSFQNPPEYNPETETIVSHEIDGKRAVVLTRRASAIAGGEYRYVLHRQGDRWLIDSLKYCDESGTQSRAVLQPAHTGCGVPTMSSKDRFSGS